MGVCVFCACAPRQENKRTVATARIERPTKTVVPNLSVCHLSLLLFICYIYFDIFLIFLYTLRPNFLSCPLCQPAT